MLFTPHTSDSSKISPFHLHVATSKPPAREIFACLGLARARGWREEFGVECYSPASSGRVPASGDTRPRERGQAVPWELARPGRRLGRVCSGQSHGGAWEQGPSPSRSWALPVVALDGVTVTQFVSLSPGPKTRENYMVLPWDGGFDPGTNSPKVTAPCSPSQSLSLRAAPPASSPSWRGTHRKGWK